MPYVLTVDRHHSQRQPGALDMPAHRSRLESSHPTPLLSWQISAGDELQALYADPGPVVEAALHLAESGEWHVGLGVGTVDTPLPGSVNEATGSAFVHAREAVEAAKTSASDTAIRGVEEDLRSQQADALLALLASTRRRRTATAQQAAELADRGMTQQRIADELGIKQSSVSRRLATALWHEERSVREVLVELLREADEVNLVDS
ncbi:transcriptional regulator [Kocuria soli]|nr:transcriptional regulator [Kocuria soli]